MSASRRVRAWQVPAAFSSPRVRKTWLHFLNASTVATRGHSSQRFGLGASHRLLLHEERTAVGGAENHWGWFLAWPTASRPVTQAALPWDVSKSCGCRPKRSPLTFWAPSQHHGLGTGYCMTPGEGRVACRRAELRSRVYKWKPPNLPPGKQLNSPPPPSALEDGQQAGGGGVKP